MQTKYRFYLSLDSMDKLPCYPIYADSIAMEYTKDKGQEFFRHNLKGNLQFVREDYARIMNAPFDTEYIVDVESWNGTEFVPYYTGRFTRTDCTINEYDRIITTSLQTIDQYNNILDGLEKEFNLIELLPEIKKTNVTKRPLVQIYVPGEEKVTCVLKNLFYEQDVTESVDSIYTLNNDYKFAVCALFVSINIKGVTTHPDANGVYRGRLTKVEGVDGAYTGTLTNANGCVAEFQRYLTTGRTAIHVYKDGQLLLISSGTITTITPYAEELEIFDYVAQEYLTDAVAEVELYTFFSRMLTDLREVRGVETYPIPLNDIVANNNNYGYILGYSLNNLIMESNESVTPTEWGVKSNGKYYKKPYRLYGGIFYPIARNSWRDVSFWWEVTETDARVEQNARAFREIADNYPLSSVISVLLQAIAPGITHEPTPDYSEILYGDVAPQSFELLLTPITNITRGDYTQPAQMAKITLSSVFNMLANMFKCYWFIDENNRLRIEHIRYFQNGGSYEQNEKILNYDLTEIINLRNGKAWAFDTSEYTFAKEKIPGTIKYLFQNETTMPFMGEPIEITSRYADTAQTEEINIGSFCADVDYMLLNPGAISEEGFAVLGIVNGELISEPENVFSSGQTGSADDVLPGKTIKGGGYEATLKFNVTIPSGRVSITPAAIDTNGNITYIGNGMVLTNSGEYTQSVIIPDNAVKITFKFSAVSASATIKFYSLISEEFTETPIIDMDYKNVTYSLQNGYLSIISLFPTWLNFDMPAKSYIFGGEAYTTNNRRKTKKQNIKFPVGYSNPNPLQLVKTYLGNGEYDSISLNLYSREVTATLIYETE